MSQASGAAREASMDEILASIRKIIEESDAAASAAEGQKERYERQTTGFDRYRDEDESDEASTVLDDFVSFDDDNGDDVDSDVIAAGEAELNAFREAVTDTSPAPPPAAKEVFAEKEEISPSVASGEPQVSRPLSLADIQARLSRSADDFGGTSEDEVDAKPETPSWQSSLISESDDDLTEAEAEVEVESEPETEATETTASAETATPDDATSPAEKVADMPHRVPSEDSFRAVAERLERGKALERQSLPSQPASRPSEPAASTDRELDIAGGLTPILSREAGRAVADSFGQLKEAFFASRQRNFDEMAEEMLRPMLQDWLDNNLPTLVERLVKEEIERIAQGG
ncbi:PopZ family protein [Notoacmeibacter ruber]|uniref:DUF2497 domain-containing protein n=1 Tax=Notoacmeibacter ruber TaxID=2670375 RepID=A0A3L7JBK6_9HYPH|nr:DUF2497 domain-containing protein [Notoacmeibacter ruber]RLQ88023.1 DUF2497 domain-containing protein [Notoacmeibacter ruber]